MRVLRGRGKGWWGWKQRPRPVADVEQEPARGAATLPEQDAVSTDSEQAKQAPATKLEPTTPAKPAAPVKPSISLTDWLRGKAKAYTKAKVTSQKAFEEATEAYKRGEVTRPPKNVKVVSAILRQARRERRKE
jgi:hypothetical protein